MVARNFRTVCKLTNLTRQMNFGLSLPLFVVHLSNKDFYEIDNIPL